MFWVVIENARFIVEQIAGRELFTYGIDLSEEIIFLENFFLYFFDLMDILLALIEATTFNLVAMLVALVASFAIGFIWYHKALF